MRLHNLIYAALLIVSHIGIDSLTMAQTDRAAQRISIPLTVTSNGSLILLSDDDGNKRWWPWPLALGAILPSKGRRGPVVTWTTNFVTLGRYAGELAFWTPQGSQPVNFLTPFTGAITAMCATGEDLFVSGADLEPDLNKQNKFGDGVLLLPGQVALLRATGTAKRLAIKARGRYSLLACGRDWLLLSDDEVTSSVTWVSQNKRKTLPLAKGPATALANYNEQGLIADQSGLWLTETSGRTLRPIGHLPSTDLRIKALQVFDRTIFAALNDGSLFCFPEGRRWTRDHASVRSIAKHGVFLLVLWSDNVLEERNSTTGDVTRVEHIAASP